MCKLKAVVFDYGKVISFPPDKGAWDEIAALAGLKWEDMEFPYKKHRGDFDRGRLNSSGFYRAILDDLNCKIDEKILKQMGELDLKSWININPETVRLMEDVKNAGLILAVLSNMPSDFLKFVRTIPVLSLPHVGIYSCETGSIKPEEAIYLKLLSETGCRSEELVFFDDVPENVSKALDLGIEARIWQDCEKARRDLYDLGLLEPLAKLG